MRALLASPLGFLIGLSLGALGGGGSILAVPVLVYAAGQNPKAATTTSLLLVGIASAVGMIGHLRAGRVAVGTGLAFGLTGIGGSLAGSALNHRLNANVLLLAFAGLVVIAAWRMVTGCPTCTRVGELAVINTGQPPATKRLNISPTTVVAVLAAGTAVGFLTGLFGVGGGFVIVPALTLKTPDAQSHRHLAARYHHQYRRSAYQPARHHQHRLERHPAVRHSVDRRRAYGRPSRRPA
jgi:uncharacterized protein